MSQEAQPQQNCMLLLTFRNPNASSPLVEAVDVIMHTGDRGCSGRDQDGEGQGGPFQAGGHDITFILP